MAGFSCDCGSELGEDHVGCSTILAGASMPDTGTGIPGSSTLVITATCPGCNVQRIGYLSSGDMTSIS